MNALLIDRERIGLMKENQVLSTVISLSIGVILSDKQLASVALPRSQSHQFSSN
jgi:hypothetical protein